ncbi:hypothetical protein [Roseibium polysiphoniae]|uniref:Uncharacterized protein n=1 Tax=Roseibium polysiphoniae TaxID=2571221 RepID=A0ABR9CBN7_9HYPH|nr:hypothetical protein [Roseibium polysiphoniae]MBD8877043.1 hypothetical protein [Roseibium polysiphoniae]
MISALVDGVLLLALAVTTFKMVHMYRELKRLGSYHNEYQRIFDQTALALDGIEVSIQELNVRGAQVLNALGSRMDDARELIAEIDGLTREAKRQQSVLKSELKELSKETALREKAARLDPSLHDDLDLFQAPSAPVEVLEDSPGSSRKNRFLKDRPVETTSSEQPGPTPTRVHRIDNTLGSPFRSISMHQKDEL